MPHRPVGVRIMDNAFVLLLPIGFVIVAVLAIVWHYSRSSSLLEQWAQRHGYRILSQQYCYFFSRDRSSGLPRRIRWFITSRSRTKTGGAGTAGFAAVAISSACCLITLKCGGIVDGL